jgi:hypothetical protein
LGGASRARWNAAWESPKIIFRLALQRGDPLVRYYKRCLGRSFPCVQFCDYRLHPRGYHSLLGGFGDDLELKKSLFFTGGSEDRIRADRAFR